MLPRYDELDLTPYFAPFYMLFDWRLEIWDMVWYWRFWYSNIFAAKIQILWLADHVSVLGLFWCRRWTFFGNKLSDIFTLPDAINNFFFSDLKMFWFAIIFGIFQIVFARILSALYAIKHKDGSMVWATLVGLYWWQRYRYVRFSRIGKRCIAIDGHQDNGRYTDIDPFLLQNRGEYFQKASGYHTLRATLQAFRRYTFIYQVIWIGYRWRNTWMVVNSVAMRLRNSYADGWFQYCSDNRHIFVLALSGLGVCAPIKTNIRGILQNAGLQEEKPINLSVKMNINQLQINN